MNSSSKAHVGGVQTGDVVLRVNGVSTAQMTTNEVMQLVRKSDGKLLLELERFVLGFF